MRLEKLRLNFLCAVLCGFSPLLPPIGIGVAEGGQTNGSTHFFGFSKSMLRNPIPMQQRGYDAVQCIGDRLEQAGFSGCLLQEHVRTLESYTKAPSPFVVTGENIKRELDSYRKALSPEDTIVIYSHSHGLMGRMGREGGLCLDDVGTGRPNPGKYLDWNEYAEQLLKLPAKTVVVLTMACHSGGLIEYLNGDPSARSRWQTRKEQGRNFLVITSQNANSSSNPRNIEGNIINPFTYAVIKAWEGKADGYRRGRAKLQPDGKITLGELADYIVDETKKHTRFSDAKNDPDPQMTGSFAPDFTIAVLSPLAARSEAIPQSN